MTDGYRTVTREAKFEFTVHKSRFIGFCAPVSSEEQAVNLLEDIRKKYWDASHHCYAYSIGERNGILRFSDDGEPGGTAGAPMVEVIRQKGVTNLVAVVTRYFGGILLGAGGLVRAYSHTAAGAIEAANPVMMNRSVQYLLKLDYPLWGKVESLLRSGTAVVDHVEYTDQVMVQFIVKSGDCSRLEKEITDVTNGRAVPERNGEMYRAWATNL